MKRICVFCGSRAGRAPAYLESARALGKAIAVSGITLVYGGGGTGHDGGAGGCRAGRGRPRGRSDPAGSLPARVSPRRSHRAARGERDAGAEIADGEALRRVHLASRRYRNDGRACSRCGRGPSSASTPSRRCCSTWTSYYDSLIAFLDEMTDAGYLGPDQRANPALGGDRGRCALRPCVWLPRPAVRRPTECFVAGWGTRAPGAAGSPFPSGVRNSGCLPPPGGAPRAASAARRVRLGG